MVRPAASLIVLAGICATPAFAGDRAMIDFIGYSPDGQYFAFEEYGSQDGSGFPYSNIYVIDLKADKWVSGTPYRVLLQDEDADVGDARDGAADLAEAKFEELDIGDAAYPIAINGDGEPGANEGHELEYGYPGYGLSPVQEDSRHTLTLETFPLDSPEDCEGYIGEKALGFSLSQDGDEIYADEGTLPKTRGCTQGYKIYAVVRPAEWSLAPTGTLAIISSYPFGFEGPDRRFLVVPLE
jgi:predicted secreted protein